MTYRVDSDVLMPYGFLVDKETNKIVSPARNIKWKDYSADFYDEKLLNLAKKKKKDVVWMSSNCEPYSKRDQFAETLNKSIQTDNLGLCKSKESIAFYKVFPISYLKKQNHDKEINDYLFYGAFENALCKDYVTEKVFSNLNRDMVLIVYGGANYSDFLPPKSYIDANQYKTTKDLADYLKFLKKNPREYIKYFWWRKYYRISNYNEYNVYCELCKKLHEPEMPVKVYDKFYDWWRGTACFEPKINIEE